MIDSANINERFWKQVVFRNGVSGTKEKKVEVDVGNEVSAVAVDSPESHQLVSPLTFLDAFFALTHVFGNLWRKNDATPSEIHFF